MRSQMKWTITAAIAAVGVGGIGSLAQQPSRAPTPDKPVYTMPRPRTVSAKEREELTKGIAERFGYRVGPATAFRAAGAFRFVGDKDFLYIDRTDTASVAFERPSYGSADARPEPETIARQVLLPRIEAAIRRIEPAVADVEFAVFDDEFVGAVEPAKIPKDFEPPKASRQVARTASFNRTVAGVPFFGSELIVGLGGDGNIGRFRLHHPKVEARLVDDARRLQADVKEGKWSLPEALRAKGIEVLETSAGVGHSGFADPGLRSAAVVRVLFRKTSTDREYPLSSTSYKYFDAAGREVLFSGFPTIPATLAARKKS